MQQGQPIQDTVALVTGANRGIGRAIAEALLERGAARVYATARDTATLSELVARDGDRVVPLQLEVTDDDQVRKVAGQARDVNLLVNNAGVAVGGSLGDDAIVENARKEMEVNYFGPLNVLRHTLPALVEHRGTVVNVASVAGLTNFPAFPTYSASKAAVHSLTQAGRMLLGARGVRTIGVYPGPVDTDMARDLELDKATPADVAKAILDGVEAGTDSVYPDAFAAQFGERFEATPKGSESDIAALIADLAG